jgi:uncharacterized protein (DUF1800 family)
VVPLCGAFEREAIRPHVTGRFADMLLASTSHPAMLIYLDNAQSIGPDSPAGRRRDQGLNENLAREILELHTLGVDGGYTQADVTAFAAALTGWSVDFRELESGAGGYRFFPGRHQPGSRQVLGRKYAQDGAEQAQAVLNDLTRHPSTARHLATKLARHFVADQPPADAVARLQRVYLDSGGDLGAMAAALVDLDAAWSDPGAKFKSAEEYLIGAQRILAPGGGFERPQALFAALGPLGQRPFLAPSPAGWPDEARAWLTADGVWKRLETAVALAHRAQIDRPLELAEQSFDAALSERTRAGIRQAESALQGLALLLSAPEMNRR